MEKQYTSTLENILNTLRNSIMDNNKLDRCADCGNEFDLGDRNECMDMCDICLEDFRRRIIQMNDRQYRMDVTRAAVAFVNQCTHPRNYEEARLRGFFAAVMPEIPVHKADQLTKKIINGK